MSKELPSIVSVLLGNFGDAVRVRPPTTSYDPIFNQPNSFTDELGRQTISDIDPTNGNSRSINHPERRKVEYDYTPRGLIDQMKDSLGRIMDNEYDDFGRVKSVTSAKQSPDQASIVYEYYPTGNIKTFTDENNHTTEYEYDPLNRLKLVRDFLRNETKYDYDKAGNVTQITDAQNYVTKYDYDNRNRLEKITDFQDNETTFKYDNEGNLIKTSDPLGHVTTHRYDGRNRRIETINADGGRTHFRYDADNNLISLTDPVGNRTLFFYDARNRLWKETDPLNKSIIYKYDGADNLVEKKNRNGRITKYEYDGLNRLQRETWVNGDNVISYTYDTENNLQSVSDQFSGLSYTYDQRDRVKTVVNEGTPHAPRVKVAYGYDPAGNVLSVIDTINRAAGATTIYIYDELDRLKTLTQNGPRLSDKRVEFSYNRLGQYDHISRYSDLAGRDLLIDTAHAYDTLNRLASIDHKNQAGTAVSFFHYQYDDSSRITQITDVDGVTTYGYDDRDQLTSADHSDRSQPDESYSYDANGNRVRSHLHGSGYKTDKGNRLKSDGIYNYEYDDEGNTILRTRISDKEPDGSVRREFIWDHRNRLTAVIDKNGDGVATQLVRFTYDALDRRISKSVDTTPSDAVDAAIMHFVYDREDVILDFVDADGSPGPAQPAVSQRYLHGPGIDQVLTQDNGTGTTLWHLVDHLGTIRDLASNTGAINEHLLYNSFGANLVHSSETPASRYGFTAREWESETTLHYYRARYYDGVTGRFLSEDPLRLSGGLSFHVYVGNNPLSFVDFTGLDRYVIIVGDPGLGSHNVGRNFERAANTRASQLRDAGHAVEVVRASTVTEIRNAINSGIAIDGGVEFFGHGSIDAFYVGEQPDPGTNLDATNVNTIGPGTFGPSARGALNSCYGGSGGPQSIAQLIADALGIPITTSDGSFGFSDTPGVPFSGRYPPNTGPLHMVPAPGGRTITFTPRPRTSSSPIP